MIRTIISTFLLIPLLLFSQKKDQKAVLKAFDNFQKAIFENNGKVAFNYLAPSTIEYVDATKKMALYYPKGQLLEENFITKIIVLGARLKVNTVPLEDISLDLYFQTLLENNLIGSELLQLSIRDILFDNGIAICKMGKDRTLLPLNMNAIKIGEDWKFEIESIHHFLSVQLAGQLKHYPGNMDDFISSKLQEITKTMVVGSVWEPEVWRPDSIPALYKIENEYLVGNQLFSISIYHPEIDSKANLIISDSNFQIIVGPELHTSYTDEGSKLYNKYLIRCTNSGSLKLPIAKYYCNQKQINSKDLTLFVQDSISMDSINIDYFYPTNKYLQQEGNVFPNYFAKYPGVYKVENGLNVYLRAFTEEEIVDLINGFRPQK